MNIFKNNILRMLFVCVGLLLSGGAWAQVTPFCAVEGNGLDPNDPISIQIAAQMQAHIDAYTAARINQNTTFVPVVIPVIFHVLYNTAAQNIATSIITDQMNILNADYSQTNADFDGSAAFNPYNQVAVGANNLGISFCLAKRDPEGNPTTGIIRKATTKTNFSTSYREFANPNIGGSAAWPTDQYLNIWVVPALGNAGGYCQPIVSGLYFSDGPVVRYDIVGNNTTTYHTKGRALVHEVGHWLNLNHVGSGSCNPNEPNPQYNDGVADTPPQYLQTLPTSTNNCPPFPYFQSANSCTATAPYGEMWMNHMDYTQDICRWMFTRGQADRMQALFTTGGFRESIRNSQGCVLPTSVCGAPVVTTVTNLTATTATVNWQPVVGAASYTLGYYYNIGDPTTANTYYATINAPATAYTFSSLPVQSTVFFFVKTNCGTNNSSTVSPNSSFTTLPSTMDCGTIPTGYRYINGTAAVGIKASQIDFLTGNSPASVQGINEVRYDTGHDIKWVVAGKLIMDIALNVLSVAMDIKMCPNASIEFNATNGGTNTIQPITGTIQSATNFKWNTMLISGNVIYKTNLSNTTIKDADIAITKNTNTSLELSDCTFQNNRIGIMALGDVTVVSRCIFKADAFVKGTLSWPEIGIKTIGSNRLSINKIANSTTTFTKLRYGILADGWADIKTTGIIRLQSIDAWTSASSVARAPDAGIGLYLKHGARMTTAYNTTLPLAQIVIEGGYKGVVVNNSTAKIESLTSQDWNSVQTLQPITFLSCRDRINTMNNSTIAAGLVLVSDNTTGSMGFNNNVFNASELAITNMSAGGTPAAYSVIGNTFSINEGLSLRLSGINSANLNNALVRDNKFYITPHITNSAAILQNCSNITFEHNAIKNRAATTFTIPTGIQPISPQVGIYAFNVKNSSISCNDITDIRTGITLLGAQNNNKIETNQFGKHWLGIAYGATALTLPVQATTAGNRFASNAADMTRSAWNQTAEVSPAPNIWAGQLYGPTSNQTYYPPKQWAGSTAPAAFTWFQNTFNQPNTCTYQPALATTSSDIANQMAVATGQRSATVYSDEVQYLAQKDLYEAVTKDPSLALQNQAVQDLVDSLALTPMAEFVALEEDAKEQPAAYDALKLQLVQYETQLAGIRTQLETAAAAGDDAAVATWKQLYTTTEAAFETAQKDAENLLYEKASELRAANNLIAPTQLQEVNQKAVNNLYLQTFAKHNHQIGSTDREVLTYIAAQCPYTGGNAVFEARDMLQTIGIATNYDDLALCKAQGVSLRVKQPVKNPSSGNLGGIKVYPNPAHDYFTIESNTAEGSIHIIDVLGRTVLAAQTLQSKQTITTHQMPEGVYQVLIRNLSDEIIHVQKIIVIH